jgi:hypothetical protein
VQNDQSIAIEIIIRILCDITPEKPVDAAYLYAQTHDNAESVLLAGADVYHKFLAPKLFILNTTSTKGYDGYCAWKNLLRSKSIPEASIIKIDLYGQDHNTLTEAQALVQHAKKYALETILVIAPPFHLPRAFMTTIRAASSKYPGLKIYSRPGITFPWHNKVVHSQGILRAKRFELIGEELNRIHKYAAKQDLSSFQETKRYLDRRDCSPA